MQKSEYDFRKKPLGVQWKANKLKPQKAPNQTYATLVEGECSYNWAVTAVTVLI